MTVILARSTALEGIFHVRLKFIFENDKMTFPRVPILTELCTRIQSSSPSLRLDFAPDPDNIQCPKRFSNKRPKPALDLGKQSWNDCNAYNNLQTAKCKRPPTKRPAFRLQILDDDMALVDFRAGARVLHLFFASARGWPRV